MPIPAPPRSLRKSDVGSADAGAAARTAAQRAPAVTTAMRAERDLLCTRRAYGEDGGSAESNAGPHLGDLTTDVDDLRLCGPGAVDFPCDVLTDARRSTSCSWPWAGRRTVRDVITAALSSVREAFGWSYGSFWEVHPDDQALRFVQDSGSVSEEFRRVTAEARFREGEGLNGQAWQTRDLVFVPDLGEMKTCSRAPVARRSGLKSGVCFPILLGGRVLGTMDFLTEERITPSEGRLDALRNVGPAGLLGARAGRPADAARPGQEGPGDQGQPAHEGGQGRLRGEPDRRRRASSGDDDMGRLGEALGRMIADLKHIIGQVIESASQFAEGSRVVAESASYLSESAQNQAATVEEMSASIQQLSHSIVEINQNVSAASTPGRRGPRNWPSRAASRSSRRSRPWS